MRPVGSRLAVSNKLRKLPEESVIRMGEVAGLGARYTFTIVDAEEAKDIQKFSCFLVPLGKEGDWMFGTPKVPFP